MYRIAAPGSAVQSMDPSEWGDFSSVPWNEFSGRSSEWRTGEVSLCLYIHIKISFKDLINKKISFRIVVTALVDIKFHIYVEPLE